MPGRRLPAWMRALMLSLALCATAVPAAPAQADTVVSLTFDDGQATQFQVKDLLASHGIKGTFYVNSAKVGTSGFYMTWPQLDTLAAAGHEIGGHTLTHVDLMDTSVPEAERRRQVCEDRQNLIARGYDPVDFAYPNGWGDELAESIVRDCGYQAARRVGGIVSPNWCPSCGSPRAESLPPEDPFLVRTPSFGSGEITLSALQDVIMQAEFGGGWVPIVFHGVCTSACGEGWVRPTTLTALMDWLTPRAAQGTVVRTVRQALDPPPPPPPPTAPDTSITSGPNGTVASNAASFEFSSDQASASFECKLDAGAWGACTSPKSYSGLSNGSHTFSVRAKDGAGNVDATPATSAWTVEVPPDPAARTIVSLTFDDGEASQFQVRPMLASHGMHGTFFVNSAKVGTSGFYMTWPQVNAVAADGNEIAGHTLTHVDLTDTSVSETERRRQVCEDRQNLIARGYDPVNFAYPGGWGDALAESIVRDCGYQAARRIGGIVSPNWCPACGTPRAESLPPEDPFLVRTPAFGSGEITLSAIQNVVTQAELAGGWVPLVFHGVCESACGEGWVRPTTLAALMDWLQPRAAGTGTVVRTMRAALNPTAPPPTAPDTSITSGPNGTVASNSASFEFSSDQASASFECKLDAGAWGACTSPKSYSGLADGSHTFSVRAKDGVGNMDPSPATRTWTIDATSPDTSITTGPSGTVGTTSASFDFSATEAGASFECKLDTGAWEGCTSPKTYTVGDGSHTFSVRAKDGAGNQDGTPASRTWAVDTTAPDTSITSGPSGTVNSASASFEFSGSGSASSFECKLDAGAWAACTSPKAYSGLSNGSHTFSVRAKNAAGNVDASPATRTWTIDRTAPNTSITSGPSGTVSSTTATFTFTSTEAGSTFECRLDGGAWAACTSPKTYTGIAKGSHTFSVRAKDAAGNVDGSPANRSWKRR